MAEGAVIVKCFAEAVGPSQGTVRFCSQSGTGTGRISDKGDIEVPMCSIGTVVDREAIVPVHVKLDVEGAEMMVLAGTTRTLTGARYVTERIGLLSK